MATCKAGLVLLLLALIAAASAADHCGAECASDELMLYQVSSELVKAKASRSPRAEVALRQEEAITAEDANIIARKRLASYWIEKYVATYAEAFEKYVSTYGNAILAKLEDALAPVPGPTHVKYGVFGLLLVTSLSVVAVGIGVVVILPRLYSIDNSKPARGWDASGSAFTNYDGMIKRGAPLRVA